MNCDALLIERYRSKYPASTETSLQKRTFIPAQLGQYNVGLVDNGEDWTG